VRIFADDAILLEVADLQEADRVVSFLARDHGKRRGAARGAKRKYSRYAGQLQPLAQVRVRWIEKTGRDLVRIDSIELLRAPKRLAGDLEGILLGAYVGESVATFAPEGEPAEKLYRLLDSVLVALEAGAERPLALRYFESWLLRLAGIFPRPDVCPLCGRALAEAGAALAASGEALLCRACAGENPASLPVSDAALAFWRRIGRESLAAMAEVGAERPETPARGGAERPVSPARRGAERPVSSDTLAEVEEVAGRIRRHFLQGEIRSYRVARRTLQSLGAAGGPAAEVAEPAAKAIEVDER
jgi:DNA repair protein RecO (recombination protein O)